jgi:chromosome segregation ATPase
MTTELYTIIVTTGFIVSSAVAGGCIWHIIEQKRERKRQELMDYMNNHIQSVTTHFTHVRDEINKMSDRLDNAGYLVNDIKEDILFLQNENSEINQRITDEVSEINQRITDEVRDFSSAFDANEREHESLRSDVTDMVMRSIDDINTVIEQFNTQNQQDHITYNRDNRDEIESLYRYIDSVVDDLRSEMLCKVKKTK